jgi:23S rRNA pseudouridine1911/1915/1917 synthase
MPEPAHEIPVPENIPIDILYQDEWLAVVNKPPDMVVHPAKGNWSGTLVNALQWHFREQLSTENGQLRAGIVHRLDKDTSGVILVAKDDATHRDLAMQFETRKVFKEYVAIAAGELGRDSDYIEAALKMHPHDRLKVIVSADPDAKHALSYYEVLERFRGFTLVKVQPRTGRTHQIRVHLLHVGAPVLADKIYGGRDHLKLSDLVPGLPSEQDESLINRQALHAYRLRFRHPRTNQWIEAEAPLPPDMRRVLEALRKHRALR